MSTVSGLELKRELIEVRLKDAETEALLSGFVRSCMTISITQKDGLMLILDCQTDFVREFISACMLKRFKTAPKSDESGFRFADCEKILRLLNIIDPDSDGFEVMGIPDAYREYASAYVRGVFLGCGSFSFREAADAGSGKTGGYHLEFSFVSESLADELNGLLGGIGITFRKMVRAEKYVLYAKGSSNVADCLALMRAEKTVLKLTDTVVTMSMRVNVNRKNNCDLANMTRTAVAAVEVSDAIDYIESTVGLNTLHPKLLEAADARKNSPDASLGALAYELGISKSGLKHRFDNIIAYAEEIKHKRKSQDGSRS